MKKKWLASLMACAMIASVPMSMISVNAMLYETNIINSVAWFALTRKLRAYNYREEEHPSKCC